MVGLTRWIGVVVIAAAVHVGCADAEGLDREMSPDPAEARAFAGGKADGLLGECHAEHILLLVNDPSSDGGRLVDDGVHRRAARNIAEFRAGPDEVLGTDRDRYFRRVEEIDDVPYVGPVAMAQLAGAVDSYCREAMGRRAETVFSPRPEFEGHIRAVVEAIDGAERSIDMAMYALSDHRVTAALGEAVRRGVSIRLLYDGAREDQRSPEGTRSARLEELGVDVRYVNRSMHHKFAIIDGPRDTLLQASEARFFSGSANLVYFADARYDENTTFHRQDPSLVLKMQREFNHLWSHSRDLRWNEELEYFESLRIDEAMIPPRSGLELLFTSENFEVTESARWGPGFRPIPFADAVVSELVRLIEGARSSIWVASRYLRSRRIAEALIDRWTGDPGLDVRVYSDQVESISEEYHLLQEEERARCLSEADDDHEAYLCGERGRIFSYALYDEGVPIRFKAYAYRWHFSHAEQMHHKYLIIDGHTVATGSYNYSNNAEQNSMENVVVYHSRDYPAVVESFVANFEAIWQTGRGGEGWFESIREEIEEGEVIDLVFEPMALSWRELRDLREAIREVCPEVDSQEFRESPEEHRICIP